MTQCTQSELPFEAHFSWKVVAQFDGARMSTEGGSLLLREADRKIGLLKRVAACFEGVQVSVGGERRFSGPIRLESGWKSCLKGENRRGETLSHHPPE